MEVIDQKLPHSAGSDLLKQSSRLSDLVSQHAPVLLSAFSKEMHGPNSASLDKDEKVNSGTIKTGVDFDVPKSDHNANMVLTSDEILKVPHSGSGNNNASSHATQSPYVQYTANFEHSLQT
jgi:hypothetical protein